MPGLVAVREAAVVLLRTAIPQVRRIEGFAGELSMDAAALKNLPAEAIFVAAAAARNNGPPDTLDLDMQAVFGAFVVTRGRRNAEVAEADGLALAECVTRTIHGATYGLAGVGPARVVILEPVADSDLDSKGVRVWSVVWEQNLLFGDIL